MSRKHYQMLAEALRVARPLDKTGEGYAMWFLVRDNIMSELKRDNSNFDKDRFITWTEK